MGCPHRLRRVHINSQECNMLQPHQVRRHFALTAGDLLLLVRSIVLDAGVQPRNDKRKGFGRCTKSAKIELFLTPDWLGTPVPFK